MKRKFLLPIFAYFCFLFSFFYLFFFSFRLRKTFPSSQKSENVSIKTEPELIIPSDATVENIEHVYENNVYNVEHVEQQPSMNENPLSINHNNEIQNYVEQISTEKLSLNDLLHFKESTITVPGKITTGTHENSIQNTNFSNVPIISEIKTTTEQYTQTSSIIFQDNLSSSFEDQQLPTMQQQNQIKNNISETIEDKLNYFRIKEAELKYQERLIQIERLKIDLEKSTEELRFMKEMNQIKIEEMKNKIKIPPCKCSSSSNSSDKNS